MSVLDDEYPHNLRVLKQRPAGLYVQGLISPQDERAVAVVGTRQPSPEGLAYWLHVRVIRHVTPVAAMSPAFMIPVFGVTWGHLFLGEPLGSGIWSGGALILLAIALVTGFNPVQKLLDAANARL